MENDASSTCVSIIIPCYRNEREIQALKQALDDLYSRLDRAFYLEVIFVDDGSDDTTRARLIEIQNSATYQTKIVCLTGNFGSYPALHAGMSKASGDAIIQLHADLQDPPHHIPNMLEKWKSGAKVVIGQRVARNDGFWNDLFASIYHSMVRRFALNHIPAGGYDLILIDREVASAVLEISPHNVNLVYVISSLKHEYEIVPVERVERTHGVSQWSASGKIKLVIDTMLAFSYWPVRLLRGASFLITAGGALGLSFFLFFAGATWWVNMLALVITFWGAVVVWGLTLIVEYSFRIHQKTSGRPAYVIDQVID